MIYGKSTVNKPTMRFKSMGNMPCPECMAARLGKPELEIQDLKIATNNGKKSLIKYPHYPICNIPFIEAHQDQIIDRRDKEPLKNCLEWLRKNDPSDPRYEMVKEIFKKRGW